MNNEKFFLYLIILAGSTYLLRAIPFVAVKNKIQNTYIRSFLHYIPYTVLAAMTVPSVFFATDSIISAAIGLVFAIAFALWDMGLTTVALVSCATVFLSETILNFIK